MSNDSTKLPDSADDRTLTEPQKDGIDKTRLVKRAKRLAWAGISWHWIEAVVAIWAGLAASSIALIGFGADSLIETAAGFVVVWRFAKPRAGSVSAEQRAQRLIAISFFVLAVYIGVEVVRTVFFGDRPEVSWVGIGLASVTLLVMPPLAMAKSRIGVSLGSSATVSEGRQNMICAYLSAALLVGLGGNAIFGLWWLDPVAALFIAGIAVKEGLDSWRGDSCCS